MINSKRATLVWIDMRQFDEDLHNDEAAGGQDDGANLLTKKAKGYENWWPGMRRWHLGMICKDATLELGEPEIRNQMILLRPHVPNASSLLLGRSSSMYLHLAGSSHTIFSPT